MSFLDWLLRRSKGEEPLQILHSALREGPGPTTLPSARFIPVAPVNAATAKSVARASQTESRHDPVLAGLLADLKQYDKVLHEALRSLEMAYSGVFKNTSALVRNMLQSQLQQLADLDLGHMFIRAGIFEIRDAQYLTQLRPLVESIHSAASTAGKYLEGGARVPASVRNEHLASVHAVRALCGVGATENPRPSEAPPTPNLDLPPAVHVAIPNILRVTQSVLQHIAKLSGSTISTSLHASTQETEPGRQQPAGAAEAPDKSAMNEIALGIGKLAKMSAQDEFICGRCGATSQWGERYYQDRTPDSPFPEFYPGSGGWDCAEHHTRAFCPKCGALVAERQAKGFGWADGARPKLPDKLPSFYAGGEWVFPFAPYRECFVPYGENTLDIEGFKRADAAATAKEQSRKAMSVPDLIRRLRESKGKKAAHIEMELTSRGETAIPYLVEALRDPEVYLRWRTCYVLAEMRDKAIGARPALEIALRDTEEPVRTGAADALSRISKPEPAKP